MMTSAAKTPPSQQPARWEKFQMPWVESPFFEDILASRSLTPAQRELATAFNRQGYVILDLRSAEFDALAQDIIRELQGKYDHEGRATNAWKLSPATRALAINAQVMESVSFLYGREPIPYQTLNFDRGTEQHAHSDLIHFASVPTRYMCGAWVALEDVDERNGALFYYEGSHREPVWTLEDLGVHRDVKGIPNRLSAYVDFMDRYCKQRGLVQKQIKLKRGQAVIWSSNLFHGGSPILEKGSTRYSQVTHFFFEGCQYYAPLQSTVFDGDIRFLSFENIATGKLVAASPAGTLPQMAAAPSEPTPSLINGLKAGLRGTSPAAYEFLKRVTRPLRER